MHHGHTMATTIEPKITNRNGGRRPSIPASTSRGLAASFAELAHLHGATAAQAGSTASTTVDERLKRIPHLASTWQDAAASRWPSQAQARSQCRVRTCVSSGLWPPDVRKAGDGGETEPRDPHSIGGVALARPRRAPPTPVAADAYSQAHTGPQNKSSNEKPGSTVIPNLTVAAGGPSSAWRAGVAEYDARHADDEHQGEKGRSIATSMAS